MNLFEGGFRVRACSKSGWNPAILLRRTAVTMGPPPGDRWHADMVAAFKTLHSQTPPEATLLKGAFAQDSTLPRSGHTSGALRQSAEDLQRCDNGCSVSY